MNGTRASSHGNDESARTDRQPLEDLPEIPCTKTPAWRHQRACFWWLVSLFGGLPPQSAHYRREDAVPGGGRIWSG